MLSEKETSRLTLFLIEEDMERSPAGQEESYQELLKEYELVREKLFGELDDRRLELLEELLGLREQLEYVRNLHYVSRALARGERKKSGQTEKIS